MKKILDISNWARKDHFQFFSKFEEPFFGITTDINCTNSYRKCKEEQLSFFLYYLHKVLIAANRVEPFRYRIEGEDVAIYDVVNVSPTINRPDGTFGFAYIDYIEDYDQFVKSANSEIEKVRNSKGLIPAISGENVIHFSTLPWIKFTSLSHARSYSFRDSCPKITFGKMNGTDQSRVIPVSIHVHHALMDGIHVGMFVDELQGLLG